MLQRARPSRSPWCYRTIEEIQEAFLRKEVSSEEITLACIEQIEQTRSLNMWITTTFHEALAAAKLADTRRQEGTSLGPLDGIPVGFKDNYCTKNILTTAGSKMLENFRPPYESTATARLLQAGAVPLGKLNMDEFAMGSATIYSHFGATINPWSRSEEIVAGGSSGGSAAAVAAGCCFATLGSDTGGSVRQPAAYCGVVGLKPNYGRISRYGLIAFASSLDTPGIFTRSIRDSALVLNTIAGHDSNDSTSLTDPLPKDWCLKDAPSELHNITIGIPDEYCVEELPQESLDVWYRAIEKFQNAGVNVVNISLPMTKYAVPAYYVIACAEASSNLSRYDGIRYGHRAPNEPQFTGKDDSDALHDLIRRSRTEGFGNEIQRRILSGTFVLSAGAVEDYYERAIMTRQLIRQEFDDIFHQVDYLLTPTTPTAPFTIATAQSTHNPVDMYLNDVMTIPSSLAGLPAISIPFGISNSNTPLAIQLIASSKQEAGLLEIGRLLE